MIEFFHVYKAYKDEQPVLEDVTLSINKGDFVFISGPSGAGKSTLLKLIFYAEKASRGQLYVSGFNLSQLKRSSIPCLRRNIGVVFQDFQLLPRRTVQDNVGLTLEILGLARKERRRRTFEMLQQVGLGHRINHYPPELSGGEQQRVALARAMINEPQILIADEPTGNLDSQRAKETMELLRSANIRGTTVLCATHNEALMKTIPAKRIQIDRGRTKLSHNMPLRFNRMKTG
ncbi:MAG: cell division ATP-binding protein FtsE [Myxococcota bacterium]|nr:cell division ATP-binding protein FtsE [Myxococcota bacterium]